MGSRGRAALCAAQVAAGCGQLSLNSFWKTGSLLGPFRRSLWVLLGAVWSLHPHLSLHRDVWLDGLIPNSFWSKPDLYDGGGFVNSDFLLSTGFLKTPRFYLGCGNGFCCAPCYLGSCITVSVPAHQHGLRFPGWGLSLCFTPAELVLPVWLTQHPCRGKFRGTGSALAGMLVAGSYGSQKVLGGFFPWATPGFCL